MNKAISILLVDGHELVRLGLRHMLESEEDMRVVGDCASAEEALSEIARLHQDIVLMGTQLPGMNWIEATRCLKGNRPKSGGDVILLSESMDCQAEALGAGAASCLLKDVTHVELARTIREVYRNRHSLKECAGLVEEVIELVIPRTVNAAQLLRFMCQLGEILHSGFASIICTVGSWDRDTTITIRAHSADPSSLLLMLANMPEVAKVEEEPLTRYVFSSLHKKFRFLPKSSISPSKRLRVTLQETGMVRHEPATIELEQEARTGAIHTRSHERFRHNNSKAS